MTDSALTAAISNAITGAKKIAACSTPLPLALSFEESLEKEKNNVLGEAKDIELLCLPNGGNSDTGRGRVMELLFQMDLEDLKEDRVQKRWERSAAGRAIKAVMGPPNVPLLIEAPPPALTPIMVQKALPDSAISAYAKLL